VVRRAAGGGDLQEYLPGTLLLLSFSIIYGLENTLHVSLHQGLFDFCPKFALALVAQQVGQAVVT
jgi:hypothetical protein